MSLLQLQSGTKAYGGKTLFTDASFAINEGEHVGVIGPNGAGKTTLFKILIGQEDLDGGMFTRARELRIAYLSQHDQWDPMDTGNLFLERHTSIPLWELKASGRALQLSEELLSRPIMSLSGGYRMRIKLLSLLGSNPQLLLLDEPTNYLDLETTLLLEKFLQGFEGAFLLISHDREFLRRTTDHILEIESGEMTKYNGNIDDYFEQKQLWREQTEARAAGLAEKRKAILDFVARFGAKATKARQAQSRLKSLAKMETIDIKALPSASRIRIPPPLKTGKLALSVDRASFGYGQKTVLRNVTLQIERGDHVAVVGLNGAGKSTLLKGISASLAPQSGSFTLGLGVEMAFFAQHVIEALDPADTVLRSLERAAHPDLKPQDVLDLAGSLLFSGDDVKKNISMLSGGEKSRVALGRVLLQKKPCLVLDEPTNHLDFQTVEALTSALSAFEGTILVVSHDRSFIKRVGSKILEVVNGEVRLYPGTYEEYVWSLQKIQALEETQLITREKKTAPTVSPQFDWRDIKKKQDRDLRQCERKLMECEKALEREQAALQEANLRISQGESSAEWIEKLGLAAKKVAELEEQWLELSAQKEELISEK